MTDADERSDVEFTKVEKRSSSASEKKKVELQISAISTPKGDVPTVSSLERVVDGLNILDSEFSAATDEIRKNVLSKIKDLEKDIGSMKKLISEATISIEATFHKISELEPKLGKAVETAEIQKTESTELARYIGAVTNNLRREFSDNINLLEKKLSEEIKKTANTGYLDPKEYSTKLENLQNYVEYKVGETSQLVRDTRKSIEGLKEDLGDLVKFLGDTLAGISRRLDTISSAQLASVKAADIKKGREENTTGEVRDIGSDTSGA